MTLYAGEDYYLQIDSHTCFDRNWDITLIDTLETISKGSSNTKVVTSTRPFAFEVLSEGSIKKYGPLRARYGCYQNHLLSTCPIR